MGKQHNDFIPAKDGLDNTGTQGYDSLSDDAYTGTLKPIEHAEPNDSNEIPLTIEESGARGEKIIFDLVIKEKLAHVIVTTDGLNYHLNLDGEDIGRICKNDDGSIDHYPQPKGAHLDTENYIKPIEAKLKTMHKL
jgi:hypothetical protein